MKFILLQSIDAGGLIVGIIVLIAIFIICRGVLLWFWKVDVLVNNQQEQINQNKKMLENQDLIIKGLVMLNKRYDASNAMETKIANGKEPDVIVEKPFEGNKRNAHNKTFVLFYSSKEPLTGGSFNVLVGSDNTFRKVPIGRDNSIGYEVSPGDIKVLIGASGVVTTEKKVFLTALQGMDTYFDVSEYYYS